MIQEKRKSLKKIFCWLFFFSCFVFFGYFYFHGFVNFFPIDKKEKEVIQIIDDSSLERPYAVMINNISIARPYHSGLQDAYLVYEMIVEGGITRFLALFHNQDTKRIGPIRSARPYYLDYVMENDAYFVHWGFSDQAKEEISRYKIQNINGLYQERYFWKDKTLSVASEHTAFTSMEKLKQAVQDLHYREERKEDFLLSYVKEVSVEEGALANRVVIPYSKGTISSYRYDPEKQVYLRYVNDEAHIDYVTKEQYTVKNIILYQVKNSSIASYGRQKLDNLIEGDGYYITNGKAVQIHFQKRTREGKTIFTNLDGTPLKLNDGNTWIQIQPQNMEFQILE